MTVGDIVEVIRKFVPDLRVELVDAAIMNQLSYTVSPAKFRALGFEYQGNLEQGIRSTVELLRGVR